MIQDTDPPFLDPRGSEEEEGMIGDTHPDDALRDQMAQWKSHIPNKRSPYMSAGDYLCLSSFYEDSDYCEHQSFWKVVVLQKKANDSCENFTAMSKGNLFCGPVASCMSSL